MSGRLTTSSGVFRIVTIVLLLASIWTAYANVFSDDTDLRARADASARAYAGCGAKCTITGIRGSRGMLEERVEYDIVGVRGGTIVVACRRPYIALGDYACEAKQGE